MPRGIETGDFFCCTEITTNHHKSQANTEDKQQHSTSWTSRRGPSCTPLRRKAIDRDYNICYSYVCLSSILESLLERGDVSGRNLVYSYCTLYILLFVNPSKRPIKWYMFSIAVRILVIMLSSLNQWPVPIVGQNKLGKKCHDTNDGSTSWTLKLCCYYQVFIILSVFLFSIFSCGCTAVDPDFLRAVYRTFLCPAVGVLLSDKRTELKCKISNAGSIAANRAEPNRALRIWTILNRTEPGRMARKWRDPTIRPAPILKALSGTEPTRTEPWEWARCGPAPWSDGSSTIWIFWNRTYDKLLIRRTKPQFFVVHHWNRYSTPSWYLIRFVITFTLTLAQAWTISWEVLPSTTFWTNPNRGRTRMIW